MCKDDSHHNGLQHDLRAWLRRRQVLQLGVAAGAAGMLTGCDLMPGMSHAQAEKIGTAEDGSQCVLHTTETAGPFPADGSNNAHGTLSNVLENGGVVRRDLRSDLGQTGEPVPGERLELTLRLENVNDSCKPLEGYAVYLWHCDAEGNYSIYNVEDRSFLRGVGVSDRQGQIAFTTVVPGCYRGRYPHMHFEVYPSRELATDYRNRILTSQLAIPAETCRTVYGSNPADVASLENFKVSPLETDGIFQDNTAKQLASQTISVGKTSGAAYRGEVVVGLAV